MDKVKLKQERRDLNRDIKMIREERNQLLREQRPLTIRVYEINRLLKGN